jgi:hypothetical protein
MAALAEAEEGGVRVLELWQATFHPEAPPLFLQVVDVISRSKRPGIMIRFRIENGKTRLLLRRGEGLHRSPVGKPNQISVKRHGVIRHVAVSLVLLSVTISLGTNISVSGYHP